MTVACPHCTAAGPCRRCRMRAMGLANRRYAFTPALDDDLRAAYAQRTPDRARGINRLVRQTGWPRKVFYSRGVQLGLARHSRPWTLGENERLAGLAERYSIRRIARCLNRSESAVRHQISKLHLYVAARSEGYSVATIAEVFGVSRKRVRGWIRNRYFAFENRHRVTNSDIANYWVSSEAVVRFLRNHPEAYDLRLVDQVWYKSMLFGDLAMVGV